MGPSHTMRGGRVSCSSNRQRNNPRACCSGTLPQAYSAEELSNVRYRDVITQIFDHCACEDLLEKAECVLCLGFEFCARSSFEEEVIEKSLCEGVYVCILCVSAHL